MRFSSYLRKVAAPVIVAAALAIPGTSFAANLHAILIIDTDDKNIGAMVARDMNIIGKEITEIAKATGLTLKDKVYAGRDFTLDNMKSAINDVQAGPNDVVFFYYSGHGFRTKDKKNRWPYPYFHSNRTVDFGWIADSLRAKGARLTISLIDACNNVVNIQVREDQKSGFKSADGYKELFLNAKGYVTGASSIPGETSTATGSGSLFTLAWLKALRNETSQSKPNWDSLMRNAAGKRLTAGSSSQQPFYEMSVARATTQQPATANAVRPAQPPAPTVQRPASVQPPAPTVRQPAQRPQPQQPQQQPQQGGAWQSIF